MSDNHSHHDHGKINYTKAFAFGAGLNLVFVLVEAFYGYFSNSLALLADAGHNFSDVIGLFLAWGAAWLGTRRPSARFTYGFGHTSILAALANALLLLAAVGAIFWEGIVRFRNPEPVSTSTVVIVAIIGIIINAFTAYLFMSGRKNDLNVRGAYLHMASDAIVSAGVVVAGLLIKFTGWTWLDSLVSMAIAVVIFISTWSLLRDSINLSIAAVPHGIDPEEVKKFLKNMSGVSSVHDLHVWAMSTTETALTAHIVMPSGHPGDNFLKDLAHELEHKFTIHHSTIQIETGNGTSECKLGPDEVI